MSYRFYTKALVMLIAAVGFVMLNAGNLRAIVSIIVLFLICVCLLVALAIEVGFIDFED